MAYYALGRNNTIIGRNDTIAIGRDARATENYTIAIGRESIAIGGVYETPREAVALGHNAEAGYKDNIPCDECCTCCAQVSISNCLTVCPHHYQKSKKEGRFPCIFSLIEKLQQENEDLKKRVLDLEYAPGGPMYLKHKEEVEDAVKDLRSLH